MYCNECLKRWNQAKWTAFPRFLPNYKDILWVEECNNSIKNKWYTSLHKIVSKKPRNVLQLYCNVSPLPQVWQCCESQLSISQIGVGLEQHIQILKQCLKIPKILSTTFFDISWQSLNNSSQFSGLINNIQLNNW